MVTTQRPEHHDWTRCVAAAGCLAAVTLLGELVNTAQAAEPRQPNILWLTVEDISPYLGSYGHKQAHTPNLDRLAKQGIRYTQAYANAPVCAVARSALLTGMHSPAIGTHQMRSRPQLPASIPAYPKLFRGVGYYCTNNVKTEYLALLKDGHPAVRHWGAYGLFLLRDEDKAVRLPLSEMAANDPFAGNRIIAAQALGRSGDSDTAFDAIAREAETTDDAYVFLFALNAFQYSRTDGRLTREDWERFQKKKTSGPYGLPAGLAQRIVTHALNNWPERAVVE